MSAQDIETLKALYERVEMDESVGICLSSRVEALNFPAALSRVESRLAHLEEGLREIADGLGYPVLYREKARSLLADQDGAA